MSSSDSGPRESKHDSDHLRKDKPFLTRPDDAASYPVSDSASGADWCPSEITVIESAQFTEAASSLRITKDDKTSVFDLLVHNPLKGEIVCQYPGVVFKSFRHLGLRFFFIDAREVGEILMVDVIKDHNDHPQPPTKSEISTLQKLLRKFLYAAIAYAVKKLLEGLLSATRSDIAERHSDHRLARTDIAEVEPPRVSFSPAVEVLVLYATIAHAIKKLLERSLSAIRSDMAELEPPRLGFSTGIEVLNESIRDGQHRLASMLALHALMDTERVISIEDAAPKLRLRQQLRTFFEHSGAELECSLRPLAELGEAWERAFWHLRRVEDMDDDAFAKLFEMNPADIREMLRTSRKQPSALFERDAGADGAHRDARMGTRDRARPLAYQRDADVPDAELEWSLRSLRALAERELEFSLQLADVNVVVWQPDIGIAGGRWSYLLDWSTIDRATGIAREQPSALFARPDADDWLLDRARSIAELKLTLQSMARSNVVCEVPHFNASSRQQLRTFFEHSGAELECSLRLLAELGEAWERADLNGDGRDDLERALRRILVLGNISTGLGNINTWEQHRHGDLFLGAGLDNVNVITGLQVSHVQDFELVLDESVRDGQHRLACMLVPHASMDAERVIIIENAASSARALASPTSRMHNYQDMWAAGELELALLARQTLSGARQWMSDASQCGRLGLVSRILVLGNQWAQALTGCAHSPRLDVGGELEFAGINTREQRRHGDLFLSSRLDNVGNVPNNVNVTNVPVGNVPGNVNVTNGLQARTRDMVGPGDNVSVMVNILPASILPGTEPWFARVDVERESPRTGMSGFSQHRHRLSLAWARHHNEQQRKRVIRSVRSSSFGGGRPLTVLGVRQRRSGFSQHRHRFGLAQLGHATLMRGPREGLPNLIGAMAGRPQPWSSRANRVPNFF